MGNGSLGGSLAQSGDPSKIAAFFSMFGPGVQFHRKGVNGEGAMLQLLSLERALCDQGNVYFTPAEFPPRARRLAANALSARAFWLDIDRPWESAGREVEAWCATTGYPRPSAVNVSGNGIQCFWFLREPLEADAWREKAKLFKRATSALRADETRTADIASLMRVPGTTNTKAGKATTRAFILEFEPGRLYEPEQLLAAQPEEQRGNAEARKDATGETERQYPAGSWPRVLGECAQMRRYVQGVADASEPFWRAALSIANECEGREQLIHEISADYAGYTPQETEAKAALIKGPYRCSTIAEISPEPGLCGGCALAGWGSSPIRYGRVQGAEEGNTTEADGAGIKWAHTRRYGGAKVPLGTGDNLAVLLAHYGYAARYDEMRHEIELLKDGRPIGAGARMAAILDIKDLAVQHSYPRHLVDDSLEKVAYGERYHPAADYIRGTKWDGGRHIEELARTLGTATDYPDGLAEVLLRRWMVNAAAAAVEARGVVADHVLVLQGAQGIGKTTWLKGLAPEGLVRVGASLDPSDRDSLKKAISYWLVELGELDATFRQADLAALKAFLSNDQDEVFLRYSRRSSTYPRRTAFCASVNHVEFLHDETGNRRFWTIKCAGIERDHGVDLAQAWAQALAIYQAEGMKGAWLTDQEEEVLARVNARHTEGNPYEELILARYEWESGRRDEWRTTGEVMREVDMYARVGDQKAARLVARALRALTGEEPIQVRGKGRCFLMPPFRVPGAAAIEAMRTPAGLDPEALAELHAMLKRGREPGEEG